MRQGSRVVCINDTPPPYKDKEEFYREFPQWVKKDKMYTIRDIFTNDGIVTSVVLHELRNPILYFKNTIGRSQEASFKIDRFRELTEDEIEQEKADIQERNRKSKTIREMEEVFEDIINPAA